MPITWILGACHVMRDITLVKLTGVPRVRHVVVSLETSKRKGQHEKNKLSYNVLQLILQIFCSYKSSSVLLVYKVAPNCCWIPLDPLCSSLSKFSRILPLLLPLATELPDTAGAIEMSESQFTPHKYGAQHMTCRGKKQTNITWEQILNLWPWYIWFFFLHTMCGEHV